MLPRRLPVHCRPEFSFGRKQELDDLIELGVASGIMTKMGSWYSWGETRLGQGKDNTRMFLKDNTDIRSEIETSVREHYGLDPSPVPAAPPAPETEEKVEKA